MSAPREGAAGFVVKVCGLARPEDAAHAAASGADWIGCIVAGESPRLITPPQARAVFAAAPEALPVAVMVGVSPGEALALAEATGAHRVQLHRVTAAEWPHDFPLACTFAVGVTETGMLNRPEPPAAHLLLLDTAVKGMEGGTGRTFDWHAAIAVASRRDVLLAGGLHADNVTEAIRVVRPFGVDASSALESSPGVKDPERVKRFIAAARAAANEPH